MDTAVRYCVWSSNGRLNKLHGNYTSSQLLYRTSPPKPTNYEILIVIASKYATLDIIPMGLATFVTVMLLSTAASARKHTSSFKSRVQTGNARILDKDFPFSMFGDVSRAIPSSAAIAEMLGVKPDDLRFIVLGWILPLIFYGALFYAKRAVSTLPMKANGSSTTTNEIAEKACNQGSTLSNEDDPATPEAPWTRQRQRRG